VAKQIKDDRRDFKRADLRAGLPREIPEGHILAHNHIEHHASMPSGLNGFRFWTWPIGGQPEYFVRCPCGWSGLPHYASREWIADSGKCMSDAEFEKHNGFSIEEVIATALEDEEHS
jgi:hypothetical protein